jgi:hypothetical protein
MDSHRAFPLLDSLGGGSGGFALRPFAFDVCFFPVSRGPSTDVYSRWAMQA